jgi:hypothetical protein
MAYDLVFDENLMTFISIKNTNLNICVSLSDSLYNSEDDLLEKNKIKIINFIKNIEQWYSKSKNAILEWFNSLEWVKENKVSTKESDLELLHIYILYENDDEELYGLEFRAEFDIEHGCGLKINGDYEIIEIGEGDTAFC